MQLLLLVALACAPADDDTGPALTSDRRVEFVSDPTNTCLDGALTLQAVFYEDVPRVEAEVRDGSDVVEVHDVPFGGMDEETGELYVHEAELDHEAAEAGASSTTFSCDDVPFAGWRVYDEEGALMACYFGEFVADLYDQTGCPTD
ncbi:MAG: hypothetical protein Q8P41_03315 [Pseudomonadota bacterium]|nr:hypothetical protein [Pseudomonadota bacterium]